MSLEKKKKKKNCAHASWGYTSATLILRKDSLSLPVRSHPKVGAREPRWLKSKRCASIYVPVLQALPPHVRDGAVSVCAMPLPWRVHFSDGPNSYFQCSRMRMSKRIFYFNICECEYYTLIFANANIFIFMFITFCDVNRRSFNRLINYI